MALELTDQELQDQEDQKRKQASIGKPIYGPAPVRGDQAGGDAAAPISKPIAPVPAVETPNAKATDVSAPPPPPDTTTTPSLNLGSSLAADPAAPRPAGANLTKLIGQGPPKYGHNWKGILEHVGDTIAGSTGIGTNIEQAGKFGTQGYNEKIAEANKAAGLEEGQIKAGEQERQANATTEAEGARAQHEQAQAEGERTGSELVDVKLPDGTTTQVMRKNLATPTTAIIAGANRADIAAQNNATKEDITGQQQTGAANRNTASNESKETIAGNKLDVNQSQFRDTLGYKKWKEVQDTDTKLKVAQMLQGKAPAAMLQTAEFAVGGLQQLNSARASLAKLKEEGVLGGWDRNKIEDTLFGHGLVDPSLTPEQRKLVGNVRAALTYTSSAAMRAHTGRSSREIYDDFKNTVKVGQDLDALDGALDQTHDMLVNYANAASDANINLLRSGGATSPNPTNGGTPAGGGGIGAPNTPPTGRPSVADWKKSKGIQ